MEEVEPQLECGLIGEDDIVLATYQMQHEMETLFNKVTADEEATTTFAQAKIDIYDAYRLEAFGLSLSQRCTLKSILLCSGPFYNPKLCSASF